MHRRGFLSLIGGAAVIWPLGAYAQRTEQMRRVGVLSTQATDDPEAFTRLAVFTQELRELGWTDGRDLRIETRAAAGDVEVRRKLSAELVASAPDAILAVGSGATGALLQVTRTVPIVFVYVPDPLRIGIVTNLSRPGGNVTGFAAFEYGTSAKVLEVLKQVKPSITRVAVLRDSTLAAGIGQLGAIQIAAPSLGVEIQHIDVQRASDIEHTIIGFARVPNGGLIVTDSALALLHRDLIIALAARHRLPAVYAARVYVTGGGPISYGTNRFEQFRQAAAYIDRILKGAKPADLPVQTPTKYELVINLKTAKALGLTIPQSILVRADEIIQ